MDRRPFFSIVLPTFNRAYILGEAIESVLKQTYQNWELIIIDDGSEDNTFQIIQKYTDKRIQYVFQENAGKSQARNKGISLSKGEYICFLDSDDYYYNHHLETIDHFIRSNDTAVAIFKTGMDYVGKQIVRKTPIYDASVHPVHFFALHACGINTLCIHKEILQECKFDPRFLFYQDTHLLLRILAKFPFYQIDNFTCACKEHTNRSSLEIYRSPTTDLLVENNLSAIKNLFSEYKNLLSPFVPPWLGHYLIAEKYLNHANCCLIFRKYRLAFKYLLLSIRNDKKGWFFIDYLKFLLKIPLRLLFNLPKSNFTEV